MAKYITHKQCRKMLDDDEPVVMIDVRDEFEYDTGHPEEAELLPVDEITEETAAELIPTKDTRVIVYCKTGLRSGNAAKELEKLGYTRVYDAASLFNWPYGLVW